MIGGNVFWKKKSKIDSKTKRYVLDEIKKIRNNAIFIANECDKLQKFIEGIK